MGDSLITIIAIVLAAVLMFIFPLMSVSERNDDIAQLAVQTATIEFIDDVRNTGKITDVNYDKFIQTLAATGNSYEVELEVKKLDENPGKKTAATETNKVGENLYYSVFTSQIEAELSSSNQYLLKEGDIVSVSVKNTNRTIAQMLRGFFYSLSGSDSYQVAAQHSGVVMANGK